MELRSLVATASRVVAGHGGGDLIWGHVSARDEDRDGYWIKQSGWGLEEITAERVHLLDRDGAILEGAGPRHVEYPIHAEVYAERPDVGGVVHVHSRSAVALAARGTPLLPVSHEGNYFAPHGVPRFTRTADLITTAELGAAVAEVLGEAAGIFLVNHGVVTVGPDLPSAVLAAIVLERACEVQLACGGGSGEGLSWSDPAESLAKREHIYGGTASEQVWRYLVRRLDGAD
ncbi:MAG: class II aldolase/adducin family protein [Nocardioidaceae bacterium]|nr:class II aldolase/adducin family protein [Nocardioidaceae bacterium]